MDPLETHVTVETPEQVSFSFSLAGVGSRGAAAFVDSIIIFLAVAVIWLLGAVPLYTYASKISPELLNNEKIIGWAYSILILITFAIIFGYNILLEGLMDGQTVGKRIFKLRVVRDGGLPITLSESSIRNLLRMIDYLPGPPIIGALSIVLNKSSKRLGDIVAGTIVVKEANVNAELYIPSKDSATTQKRVAQLTDKEYSFLELYINRRSALSEEIRQQYVLDLSAKFSDKLYTSAKTSAAALVRLYEDERNARYSGVSVRSDDGSMRESYSIVADKSKRWQEFSEQIKAVKKAGLSNLSGEEVSRFADSYRDVSNDLAQLHTASRGRITTYVYYVSRLVASAHSVLYRQKRNTFKTIVNFIIADIPQEIRRSYIPVLLSTALFLIPAVATYSLIIQKPERSDRLVSMGMKMRAEAGIKAKKEGEGYIKVELYEQPILASNVITNNIRVSAMAFASGITGGIGTVLVLVSNGIHIGAPIAYYQIKGIADLILLFVAPHGVLELFAIFLSGAGGLLVGAALILPGNRTRKEAFIENGRRAITLLAGAVLLMFIAGVIEGNVSPRVWPAAWKVWFSAATAVFVIAYVSLGRRIQ